MARQMNLFQAYSSGNTKDQERIKSLENNVTRAFVITLKYIHDETPDISHEILNGLVGAEMPISKAENVLFDLQSGTPEIKASAQQSVVKKIILAISSRREEKPTFSCVDRYDEVLKAVGDKNRKKLLNSLAAILKKKESDKTEKVLIAGKEYSFSRREVADVYQLVHDNIPDGWIVAPQNYAILLESKVGSGRVCEDQLFRHATGSNGFRLPAQEVKAGGVRVVCATWGDVCDLLIQAKDSKQLGEVSLEITEQFLEFMEMCGEKLNFGSLVEGQYKEIEMRDQFLLLVEKMQQKLNDRGIPLVREDRPLAGLWQRFKLEDSKDIFYTLRVSESGVEISLTAHNHMKNRLYSNDDWADVLWGMCEKSGKWIKHRYQVVLHDYRLVDWKKGQQHGENDELFSYRFTLGTVDTRDDLESLVRVGRELVKLKDVKQLDITFRVGAVSRLKPEEEGTSRAENAKLLLNPDVLLDAFCDYVEKTLPVCRTVLEKKRHGKRRVVGTE